MGDAAGAAAGSEFLVNTRVAGDQFDSSVGSLANGGFVVAWTSIGQDAASSYGIYAQRYDSSGVAQGSEFRVNTQSIGDQFDATVATLSNGGFIIAWDSAGQDGGGSGVYAQRYDTAGMALGRAYFYNKGTPMKTLLKALKTLKKFLVSIVIHLIKI